MPGQPCFVTALRRTSTCELVLFSILTLTLISASRDPELSEVFAVAYGSVTVMRLDTYVALAGTGQLGG